MRGDLNLQSAAGSVSIADIGCTACPSFSCLHLNAPFFLSGLVGSVVGSWMQAPLALPLRWGRTRGIRLLRRKGVRQEAAIDAVEQWRKQMPLWTISELMHPTRDELCDLATPLKMRCKTLRPARSKSERADEPHQHPSDHGLPGSPSLSRSRYHRGSPTKAARSKAAPARRAARRPFPANVCL